MFSFASKKIDFFGFPFYLTSFTFVKSSKMKKLLLLSLLISGVIGLQAQITLTSSAVPIPGTTTYRADVNLPPQMAFSNSGTNQTWDFTGLSPDAEDTTMFYLPSSTAGGSDFPSATLAVTGNTDWLKFDYYSSDANGAYYLGIYDDPFVPGDFFSTYFSPALTAYTFPLTYGTSNNSDSRSELLLTGAAVGQPTIDSVRIIHHMNASTTVPAWGTLTIPAGTYSGTLLFRRETLNYDSIYMKSAATANQWIMAPGFPQTSQDSAYHWLTSNGGIDPYVEVTFTSAGLIDDIVYYLSSTVSTPESQSLASSVTVYPNPANEILNIKSENGETIQGILADLSGKVYANFSVTNGFERINTSFLPAGIYTLTLKTRQSSEVKKIVVY